MYYTTIFGIVNTNSALFTKNPATKVAGKGLSVWLDVSLVTECLGSGIGAGDQTKHRENGHDGGTAVADEGQGQTDNGHGADAHTHVDDHLENQRGSSTEADQTPHIVRTADAHIDTAGDDGELQNHDGNAAEEAQFFTDGGEDVVRMLGEEGAALGTVAVEQTLACQTAAGKGTEVNGIVIKYLC